jgi:hypothetical protein
MGETESRERIQENEEMARKVVVASRDTPRLPWWVVVIDAVLVLFIAGMVIYLLIGLDRHLHGGTEHPPVGMEDGVIPRGAV